MSIMDGLRRGSGQQQGQQGGGRSGVTVQQAMQQVNSNPGELIRAAGFQVPQQYIGDNRATVMHLIQSGQVGGPLMRMITPIIQRMGGGR